MTGMGQPIRTREEWAEVHATAVALGSIRAAAKAHGVSEDAAYQRARREKWLVGTPASVQAAREQRIERAEAAGVTVSERVRATPGSDILDGELRRTGQQTRHMLAQALNHAAGQARKTKHPLLKARHIRDVSAAACHIHPEQFGSGATSSGAQHGDAQQRVTVAITQLFGIVESKVSAGEVAEELEDSGGQS